MIQPIFVEPRPGYRIWVQYSDGVAGEVDLSGLVGRGVFQAWRTPGYFEKVHVASHRAIAWYDDVELCSDRTWSSPVPLRKSCRERSSWLYLEFTKGDTHR